jgi:hypothetical protein
MQKTKILAFISISSYTCDRSFRSSVCCLSFKILASLFSDSAFAPRHPMCAQSDGNCKIIRREWVDENSHEEAIINNGGAFTVE